MKRKKKNPLSSMSALSTRPFTAEQDEILSSSGLGDSSPLATAANLGMWIAGAIVVSNLLSKDPEVVAAEKKAPLSPDTLTPDLVALLQSVTPVAYGPPAPRFQQHSRNRHYPRATSPTPPSAPSPQPVQMVSSLGPPPGQGQGFKSGGSTITGRSPTPPPKTWTPVAGYDPFNNGILVTPVGYGELQDDVIATGATAMDSLKQASEESSAYIQQAIVNPDQILENTKKMSLLGSALTLYSLQWAYKLLFR